MLQHLKAAPIMSKQEAMPPSDELAPVIRQSNFTTYVFLSAVMP